MVVHVGSAKRATEVVSSEEYFFKPMEEAPIQTVALICLETVHKTIDGIVHFLLMKELSIAALEVFIMAGLASKLRVENEKYISSEKLAEVHMQAADFRLATHIDDTLFEDSNLNNEAPVDDEVFEDSNLNDEAPVDDEIDRSYDQCKASVNDILLEGPVQETEGLWQGDISAWIFLAAKGRDEVNSNHTNTDKSRVSGKKESHDDDEDDEDDDDVDDDEDDDNDEVESGDEENDDGEEGEDGNEEDDDDEEDEEEEEDEEDEEEVAPPSANVMVQIVQDEDDDDSDEGEEEEEGVEDEDDFEEDEDGEGDEEEEDEDEDEEDVPKPPRKKNKSA